MPVEPIDKPDMTGTESCGLPTQRITIDDVADGVTDPVMLATLQGFVDSHNAMVALGEHHTAITGWLDAKKRWEAGQ